MHAQNGSGAPIVRSGVRRRSSLYSSFAQNQGTECAEQAAPYSLTLTAVVIDHQRLPPAEGVHFTTPFALTAFCEYGTFA